ncbi:MULTISPECIES: hypothetical protein [unclassified Corynebacterium]|nr:hypothetical protein [Corynebacterium sp.]MDY5786287.1 hypothetical protein [Corynebacterium sp.]
MTLDNNGRAGSTPTNEDSIDHLGDPDADGDFQRDASASDDEEK